MKHFNAVIVTIVMVFISSCSDNTASNTAAGNMCCEQSNGCQSGPVPDMDRAKQACETNNGTFYTNKECKGPKPTPEVPMPKKTCQ